MNSEIPGSDLWSYYGRNKVTLAVLCLSLLAGSGSDDPIVRYYRSSDGWPVSASVTAWFRPFNAGALLVHPRETRRSSAHGRAIPNAYPEESCTAPRAGPNPEET